MTILSHPSIFLSFLSISFALSCVLTLHIGSTFPLFFSDPLPRFLTVQCAVCLLHSEESERSITQSNWVTTLSMGHTLWCCSKDSRRCVHLCVLVVHFCASACCCHEEEPETSGQFQVYFLPNYQYQNKNHRSSTQPPFLFTALVSMAT